MVIPHETNNLLLTISPTGFENLTKYLQLCLLRCKSILCLILNIGIRSNHKRTLCIAGVLGRPLGRYIHYLVKDENEGKSRLVASIG